MGKTFDAEWTGSERGNGQGARGNFNSNQPPLSAPAARNTKLI